MKNLDLIAAFIDGAIRLLYNSDKETFNEIFGGDGPYMWDKFTCHFDANEGAFICYLDYEHQRMLAKAVVEYVKKNDMRGKNENI